MALPDTQELLAEAVGRITELEGELAEAKAILTDAPDHSDIDVLVFDNNRLQAALTQAQERAREAEETLLADAEADEALTRRVREAEAVVARVRLVLGALVGYTRSLGQAAMLQAYDGSDTVRFPPGAAELGKYISAALAKLVGK